MDINKAIYKITQSVLTMSVTKSFHKKKCQLQKVEFTTAKKKKEWYTPVYLQKVPNESDVGGFLPRTRQKIL